MRRLGFTFLLAAMACGFPAAAQAQMGTIRLDNWLYYQQNHGDSVRWQYRARVFVPFAIGGGWTFTQRVDVPYYHTDKEGPRTQAVAMNFTRRSPLSKRSSTHRTWRETSAFARVFGSFSPLV